MANITKYLEKKLLQQSVGVTNTSTNNFSVSGTYAGLFITSPDADYTSSNRTGVEVYPLSGYIRKSITWGSATENADLTNSSKIVNTEALEWTATGPWGSSSTVPSSPSAVVAMGVFDSISEGNLLWFGPLSSEVTLANGEKLTLASGSLTLTLA